VDLQRQKDTRRILLDLHATFLGPLTAAQTALRAALGRHNTELIAAARAALECGDARGLGALMTEAQALFDRCVAPACRSELTAPRLHEVLKHPAVGDLTWGGKGVGSQGDGAAQFLCRGVDEREQLSRRLSAEAVHCLPLTIGAES
jgi:hypothetical protein